MPLARTQPEALTQFGRGVVGTLDPRRGQVQGADVLERGSTPVLDRGVDSRLDPVEGTNDPVVVLVDNLANADDHGSPLLHCPFFLVSAGPHGRSAASLEFLVSRRRRRSFMPPLRGRPRAVQPAASISVALAISSASRIACRPNLAPAARELVNPGDHAARRSAVGDAQSFLTAGLLTSPVRASRPQALTAQNLLSA